MKMTTKSLLAIAIMAAPTFVLADATSNLTWSGTVPAVDKEDTDFKIINTGSTEFNAGMLGITNDKNGIKFDTASRMEFNVVKTDDSPVTSYKYQISKVEFQKSGGFMESTDSILLTGNGNDITVGTPIEGAASGTAITIKTGQDISSLGLAEGDDVIVQATILVSDADVVLTAP